MTLLCRASIVIGLASAAVSGVPMPAAAQSTPASGVYVSGGMLADVKRFSGDPAQRVLDGEAPGGTIVVGTHVAPRWDLELGVDVPGFTDTAHDRMVTFQKSTITLKTFTRNQPFSVATLVRFRATAHGRVQLGYLAGLTVLRLRRDVHTQGPPNTPVSLITKPSSTVDYAAAPTLGIDARVGMTRHLSVIPGLHAAVFNLQDTGGVLLRPRLALRWDF